MPTIEITLTNAQQELFYHMFMQRRVPPEVQDIFARIETAEDLLQAFLKARYSPQMQSTWIANALLPTMREQVLKVDPDRLAQYNMHCTMRALKQEVDFTVVSLPFSCAQGDTKHAIAIWELLLGNIMHEEMLVDLERETALPLIPILIMTQKSTRTWSLLVEGVKNGNIAARKIFKKFLYLLMVHGHRTRFISTDTEVGRTIVADDMGVSPIYILNFFEEDIESEEPKLNYIPVPPKCVFAANNFYIKALAKQMEYMSSLYDLLSWFGAYENDFQSTAKQMWEEITTNPKYGLKPRGDLVRIEVEALRMSGHRHMKLIPNGFPQADAHFWMVIPEIDTRMRLRYELLPEQPLQSNLETDSAEYSLAALTDKLLQFIAVHSLWKITTGKIFKMKPKKTSNGESEQKRIKQLLMLRPHFRWLPPDHNMTDRAAGRSMESFGYLPPPGKTFVRSDPGEQGVIVRDDGIATFTYTSADLGYNQD